MREYINHLDVDPVENSVSDFDFFDFAEDHFGQKLDQTVAESDPEVFIFFFVDHQVFLAQFAFFVLQNVESLWRDQEFLSLDVVFHRHFLEESQILVDFSLLAR